MKFDPVTLEGRGVRLEPLAPEHCNDLIAVAADGRLWELWMTGVPPLEQMQSYIATALVDQSAGRRVPWIVRELGGGKIVGTTSYHDLVPAIGRVEIGYTWYAASWQRTHVNSTCNCSRMLSKRRAVKPWGCERITSICARNAPSKR